MRFVYPASAGRLRRLLKERIFKNVYPIGFKLPPERQLAEDFFMFRVNRCERLCGFWRPAAWFSRAKGMGIMFLKKLKKPSIWLGRSIGRTRGLGSGCFGFPPRLGRFDGFAAQRRTKADLIRMRNWLDELRLSYEEEHIDRQSKADVAFSSGGGRGDP